MARPDFPVVAALQYFPATIASGQSLSEAIDLGGTTLVGIQMPGSWDAANLTLQAAANGSTFGNVFDAEGTELEIAADASIFIHLDPAVMSPFAHVKLRSGTSGSPANQSGDRELTLVGRTI
jgi:hypothetical protein